MDISKLNNTLLYSNRNVEKLARKLINESANAVLMEMFDDKCIMADHTTGQIFEAKYSFTGDKFEFSDFEQITLEKTNSSLKEAISSYFDNSDVSLTESYEKAIASKSDVFESSLTEALASKNMENVVDYTEISGINESLGELKENATFKAYAERLTEKPTSSIKMFNWKDPVRVSMIDEDVNKTINKSTIVKAKKLRGNVEFRKSIMEAATASLNGDNTALTNLINENTCLLALSNADLKELVGMSLVSDRKLMESRNDIFNTIQNIVAEDSLLSEKKELLTEAAAKETDAEEDAPEASEEDSKAIIKALEKAKELASDEKLINKIDTLIKSLDDAADEGETDVAAVKESVELLSL